MLLPNRHGSSDKYRYGFGGKEKDDELKGEGNSLNYKYRMHDPRVGRFFATDPLEREYSHYSPYQFSGNKVIANKELEGAEEFSSIEAYKIHSVNTQIQLQNLDGKNGIWFTSDRVEKNHRWQNAMEFITKNEANNLFKSYSFHRTGRSSFDIKEDKYSFSIVRDYYDWVHTEIEKRGFGSRWALGAAYLVDELSDTFQDEVTTGSLVPSLGQMMKELNLSIAGYAVTMFNDVLFGGNTEVTDWYKWDKDFVEHEQRVVAMGVYPSYNGTMTLEIANLLAGEAGFLSTHPFPDFTLFEDADITDSKTDFGANGRVNIPLHMLYPERHQKEIGRPLNDRQQKQINRSNRAIKQRRNKVTKKKGKILNPRYF